MNTVQDAGTPWPLDGFVIFRRVFDKATVGRLHVLLDEHRAAGTPSRQVLYTHLQPAARSGAGEGMAALMEQWLNPHIGGVRLSTLPIAKKLRVWVRSLLQAEPVLFQDLLMSKNPGHQPFPFHQDFPFWPVAEPAGGVLWAPLDPVDEEAGGLTVACGSHLAGIGPPIDLHSGGPQPGFTTTVETPQRFAALTPVLDPGDAIWLHPLLWHRSGLNRSGRQRRVWASTWLPAEARWLHARAPRHPATLRLPDGEPVGARGWAPLATGLVDA
ncbi:MAG TPA: phytanoyl-CoA dioxygenase family protein [Pseudomonadota bacterium]|nr:phytanoyl-CoA dioxygenase family protein [Pseudomonadota bacterium]